MAITVGINNNVVIKSAVINDKKRLVIELAEASKKSLFDEALTAGVVGDSSNLSLQIFGPLLPKKEEMTQAQKAEMLHRDLKKLKNILTQILEQFLTTDAIDLNNFDIQFAGTGVTPENYETRILDQDVLNRIYDNLAGRFVQLIAPFQNDKTTPLRFKLIRQSKEKHFATIPDPGKFAETFVEHANIPAEQSKVKFSKWEIDNGLDDPTPSSVDKAEKKSGSTAAAAEATNPFA